MNQENIDVLFFVEHIDREIKGTLEVKRWLEENKNLKVHVASVDFGLYQSWKKYSPKVLCCPYGTSTETNFIKLFTTRNPNIVCVNLNYEELLWRETERYKRPKDSFAKNKMIHFVWGENFLNFLIRQDVNKNHIHIVGKPEIQFLLEMKNEQGEELRKKIAKTEKLDINKRWVFIPFNDGVAFRTDEVIDKLAKAGANREFLIECRDCAKKQIDLLFNYISTIIDKLQDVEIIYRPHPGVSVHFFEDVLRNYKLESKPSIHINRSYSIKEWLCTSEVCISNWSTTMVDAQIIGLNNYIFKPSLLAPSMRNDWMNGFVPIETVEDFITAIGKNKKNDSNNIVDWNYYIDTRKPAVERWGDTISYYVAHYTPNKNFHILRSFISVWPYLIRAELRRISKLYFSGFLVSKKVSYDYFEMI